MKKNRLVILVSAAALIILGSSFAFAHGGGNGVPSPFKCTSAHETLTDAKAYTLQGKLLFTDAGDVYFEIDAKKYPCLEQDADKRFEVSGAVEGIERYKDQTVLFSFVVSDSKIEQENILEITPVPYDTE